MTDDRRHRTPQEFAIIAVICAILPVLGACRAHRTTPAPAASTCQTVDELPAETREALLGAAQEILGLIAEGKFEELYDTAHPGLRHEIDREAFVQKRATLAWDVVDPETAILLELWRVERAEVATAFFPCGGVPRDHPDHVGVVVFPEQDLAHLVHAIPGDPVQYRTTLSLVLEDGVWRLRSFGWGYRTVHGKDAGYYLERAQAHEADGKLLMAMLCAQMARRLADRGQNISTPRHREALGMVQGLQSRPDDSASTRHITVEAGTFRILGVSLVETRGGLNPRIGYDSRAGMVEAAIEAEASALHAQLQAHHPELMEEFGAILWAAYHGPSQDPVGHYEVHDVPLPLEPLIPNVELD